jgi:EmrB/QacA subfamily drug resistance transporter
MSLQTTTSSQPSRLARPGLRPGSAAGSRPQSTGAVGPADRPQAGEVAEHQGLGLALILIAAFMVVLDFSIVNVALPSIEREFGFSAAAVQWVVTGYAIAFGGLLILGGRAADLFGRRRMFIAGLLAFSAASLAGGLARDPVLLIMSRVIQGAGAAVVAPAAFSLITTGFAEGPRRNRALGKYGATASVGFVAGQVLGGVLVQFFSWRAVFLVNVPVGVLAALLAPRLLGESRAAGPRRRLDVCGAALITTAVAATVFAVSQSAVAGWASPATGGAVLTAVAAVVAFWLVEQRHADPLVRADLLKLPSLRKASSVNVLLGLWNAGEMIVLSIYFQQVLHDSPLATGLAIAPQGIVGFAAGMLGARLAGRLGVRRVLILTSGLAMAGFLILTQLPATGSYSLLLAAVMPVGFGTAGTAFGTMVIASGGVADSDQGLVGGVVNTSRQMGAAIGAALLPAVAVAVNQHGAIAGVAGDRAAMLAAAVAAGLAMLVAMGTRAARGDRNRRPGAQPVTSSARPTAKEVSHAAHDVRPDQPGRGRCECRLARLRTAAHGRLSVTLAARRRPAAAGTRRMTSRPVEREGQPSCRPSSSPEPLAQSAACSAAGWPPKAGRCACSIPPR